MTGTQPSDTVRFSVEVLMYYAPRFGGAASDLSAAGVTAQRKLAGLGAFWGSSWPDESFASTYQPTQPALLVMAQRCAADLQGIADGIATMAHDYGITDANVKADIDRIAQGASRESALLRHTGDLPAPPDVPESDPYVPPRTTPDPRPGKMPAPPPPSHHKPPPIVTSPTPSPSPEAPPDPNAWKKYDGFSFLGPFPTGNPDLMDQAADAWRDLATAVRDAWANTQRNTAYVLSECQGPAADKFNATVQSMIDPSKGTLSLVLQSCEQTERSCRDQAQAIRDLKGKFEELAWEMVLTFVVGQIISAFTAETTQAADDAAEAGLVARAMALLREFIGAVVSRMKIVGTAIKDAVRVLPGLDRAAAEEEIAAAAQKMGIDPGKWDYLFGRVTSNPHNLARSQQLQAELARVGIYDNPEGRAIIEANLQNTVNTDTTILRTYTNQYGTFQVRESLLAGPGGFIKVESTWMETADGLKLTTIIPYGG